MNPESLSALMACQRPLLLQGPMGPFFGQLADYLADRGAAVRKVHFNGGDEFFYRRAGSVRYGGSLASWSEWLVQLLERENIDSVVLFGQARPLHRAAISVARSLSRRVFVFEEGYFRPHYVTLETEGVNGYTSLPRDPGFYRDSADPRLARPTDAGQRFSRTAWYAAQYAGATLLMRQRYPHQVYHRDLHPLKETARWIRGGLRKLRFAVAERHLLGQLTSAQMRKRWFLLALQVHNDAQLIEHSPFGDVPDVIRTVVASFAAHAAASTSLVIKHHPMDRAYRDYSDEIAEIAREFDVEERVLCVHDLHLPTLLKSARGVVTVNSTTGLQSMHHRTPVCVLGECFYAMPGLVHTGGLASFWSNPAPVDQGLYQRFRAHVVRLTQLNASFYASAPALGKPPLSAPNVFSPVSLFPASVLGDLEIALPLPPRAFAPVLRAVTGGKIVFDQPLSSAVARGRRLPQEASAHAARSTDLSGLEPPRRRAARAAARRA